MLEFAAGIMLGGSIGAVIMGALLSQADAESVPLQTEADRRDLALVHADSATPPARRLRITRRPPTLRVVGESSHAAALVAVTKPRGRYLH